MMLVKNKYELIYFIHFLKIQHNIQKGLNKNINELNMYVHAINAIKMFRKNIIIKYKLNKNVKFIIDKKLIIILIAFLKKYYGYIIYIFIKKQILKLYKLKKTNIIN